MNTLYYLAFVLLFQFLFVSDKAPEFTPTFDLPSWQLEQKSDKAKTENIVFRSNDGGHTWQDISAGLPENLREDGIKGNSFFANNKGLFLWVGNGLYHSTPNAIAPFWTQKIFSGEHSSITTSKSEKYYWGVNLKKTNGTSVW